MSSVICDFYIQMTTLLLIKAGGKDVWMWSIVYDTFQSAKCDFVSTFASNIRSRVNELLMADLRFGSVGIIHVQSLRQ